MVRLDGHIERERLVLRRADLDVMRARYQVQVLEVPVEVVTVMGAFLITYPRDQIRTVVFFGWYTSVTLVPAIVLVGLWFLTQLFSEVGALARVQTGGVAYMAHIAGFTMGAVAARLFENPE